MPRLRARSILHVGPRVVLSSKHAASRCGKFCSRRPVLFPRRQRATTPPSDMATKRPREGDAPDGGTCEPCEPATAPSVPSSNGRGLRKRPWEEEGFRCPYLDTINRTLLDFGVLLAPPHVFPPLPPPAEPPARYRFREGLLDHRQQLQRVRMPRVWQVLPRPRHAHASLHARAPGAPRRAVYWPRPPPERPLSALRLRARAGGASRLQELTRRPRLLPARWLRGEGPVAAGAAA